MSEDQFSALMAACAADADVNSAFTAVSSPAEAVDVAASLGYDVTVEDMEAYAARLRSGELGEAELGTAAGGFNSVTPVVSQYWTGTVEMPVWPNDLINSLAD